MRSNPIPALTLTALAVALVSSGASAAPADLAGKTFYFGTHPARTNVSFVSEADLETIHGFTNSISGSIAVAASGASASGQLTIKVAGLKTGIDLRDEHLRGEMWLDAANHPQIQLRLDRATLAADGRTWNYEATLTIKGRSQRITGSGTVRYISEQVAAQARLGPGAWVRVKTRFDVRLSSFGVAIPDGIGPKVSDTWAVSIDLYGTSARPQPPGR
ncbi:MAG: YceI family protein [Planctomycetota bacterium]|jgi:polyisoprenoid-binding protein YceI